MIVAASVTLVRWPHLAAACYFLLHSHPASYCLCLWRWMHQLQQGWSHQQQEGEYYALCSLPVAGALLDVYD